MASKKETEKGRTRTGCASYHFSLLGSRAHSAAEDTLCFFGFAAATADEIWGNWTDWGSDEEEDIDDGPGGFLNMATSWVDAKDIDAFTDDDDAWISAMSAYGIDEALQTVIMMPLYKDIRLTASCKELDYRYYRVTL